MNTAAFSSVASAHKRSFLNRFFIILAAGLLLITTLVCSLADAQSARRSARGKSADQIISDMKNRLNLTDEPEAKIRPIIEEQITRGVRLLRSIKVRAVRVWVL